jgi:purine-binding chemotaxis protein CheW
MEKLLVFEISGVLCALQLSGIDRIVHAVEITPAPQAPEIVMGLINVRGRVMPVLNICKLLRLPEIEPALDDQLILTRTMGIPVAILVDNVSGTAEVSERDIIAPKEIYPGIEYLEGVTKLQDGILYIYNLDRFLSSAEKAEIDLLLSGDMPVAADMEL